MIIRVSMFNSGGLLEMREVDSLARAKEELLDMIQQVDLYGGDRFEVKEMKEYA